MKRRTCSRSQWRLRTRRRRKALCAARH
jgi:hypothetical protein